MDTQTIIAITKAMEKIERRYPETYETNKRWIKMNADREHCYRELAKQELAYHKDRFNRTGDIASAKKVKAYEKYLEKVENKGEQKNGIN